MIFMPLEPLANEAIQVHSILYALARNNAIIKLTIGLLPSWLVYPMASWL